MAFSTTRQNPEMSAATEYTLHFVDGREIVMVQIAANPDKVYFAAAPTRYHSEAVFRAGVDKVIAAGGSVTERAGWDWQ